MTRERPRTTGRGPTFEQVVATAVGEDEVEVVVDPFWCHVVRRDVAARRQGWKLHLSVTDPEATALLQTVLPVLREHRTTFKVAKDAIVLARLNDGYSGLSQVGKFMTIYPADDSHAVALAVALDEATADFRGPWIPSDRALRRGSSVYYRYGTFLGSTSARADGSGATLLETPDGPVADERYDIYVAPTWTTDPFIEAGVAEQLAKPSPVIDDRFLVVDTINRSARGAIHLAVDMNELQQVVLKRAHRWSAVGEDGRDAVDRLHSEGEVLLALQPNRGFPAVTEVISDGEDRLLVMEDVNGPSLEDDLMERRRTARPYPAVEALEMIAGVADLLAVLHERGWIHRDCKPANVHVRSDGQLVLIDHELTGPPNDLDLVPGGIRGTIGYISPELLDANAASPSDDVYALGSMLHEAVTLEGPRGLPDPFAVIESRPEDLDPTLPDVVVRLRDRLLAPAGERPADAAAAGALLRQATAECLASGGGPTERRTPALAAATARRHAQRIVDWLAATARQEHDGPTWPLSVETGGEIPPSLYDGQAGVVLGLALAAQKGLDGAAALLEPAARRIAGADIDSGPGTEGGLFTGELGVALALDVAADALGDGPGDDLRARAVELGLQAAEHPHDNLDLLSGSAGRAYGHLLLHRRGHGDAHLDAASAAVQHLLDAVRVDVSGDGDRLRWVLPRSAGVLGGKAYRGYGHGAAGIADALLAVGRATGDGAAVACAREVVEMLMDVAVPVLPDDDGVNWPEPQRAKDLQGLLWCYGAPGVSVLLRRFLALEDDADVRGMYDAALRASAAARYMGPSRCHGLAGTIGVLLDAGDSRLLEAIRHQGALLARVLQTSDEGRVRPRSGDQTLGPGLSTGATGVLVAMLRLADETIADPLVLPDAHADLTVPAVWSAIA